MSISLALTLLQWSVCLGCLIYGLSHEFHVLGFAWHVMTFFVLFLCHLTDIYRFKFKSSELAFRFNDPVGVFLGLFRWPGCTGKSLDHNHRVLWHGLTFCSQSRFFNLHWANVVTTHCTAITISLFSLALATCLALTVHHHHFLNWLHPDSSKDEHSTGTLSHRILWYVYIAIINTNLFSLSRRSCHISFRCIWWVLLLHLELVSMHSDILHVISSHICIVSNAVSIHEPNQWFLKSHPTGLHGQGFIFLCGFMFVCTLNVSIWDQSTWLTAMSASPVTWWNTSDCISSKVVPQSHNGHSSLSQSRSPSYSQWWCMSQVIFFVKSHHSNLLSQPCLTLLLKSIAQSWISISSSLWPLSRTKQVWYSEHGR